MSCDENVNLACAAIIIAELTDEKPKKKKRKVWCKEWLLKRSRLSHIQLIEELRSSSKDFCNYLRMSEDNFMSLLEKVRPLIEKQDTVLRTAITCEERLAVTIRFLATGRSYEDVKFSAIISPQALGNIIPETCRAIYTVLKNKYMKFPQTEQEWLKIETDFQEVWNFPHCVGALDGKHIRIIPPPGSGSFYYNYKGFFSIVLMACVDANYKFLMVDVGVNGRVSDGGVIEHTKFYDKLKNSKLKLPDSEPLPRSRDNKDIPRVFLGDDAFALSNNLMKPFSHRTLAYEEQIFNYRLSRARRVVENAFGILSSRFRIFHTAINLKPEKVETIVLACCALHNFLRENARSTYSPPQLIDSENIESGTIIAGEWRGEPQHLIPMQVTRGRNAPLEAKSVRDHFKRYFMNEGKVLFQDRMVQH